ncbi:MAG: hypothetical protein ACLP0J_21800 [Solirubrobacteraceae bacterium]
MRPTLQINFAPPDLRHVVELLPHQLRVWAGQVSEILFTLDALRPSGGRFAQDWERNERGMGDLLSRFTSVYRDARVGVVEASGESMRNVSRRFFGTDRIPPKDSRGGPLYSYFYGLNDARNDLVLHMDSDMLFGGCSQTWLAEAVELLHERHDVVFVSPLPGPPRSDSALLGQPYAILDSEQPHMYRFPTVSTRIFLLDRRRLAERVGPLELAPPLLLRSRIKARIGGRPSVAMPEQILSRALRSHGLERVDFLGRDPGMWSLHPPFRSETFYRELAALVSRVEAGDVPDEQRGHYDVVDQLLDFSDVRAKMRRSPLTR